jgi:hypothetical protein
MDKEDQQGHDHIEHYTDDSQIASFDAKVPKWLILTYIILPIWGVLSFCYFWNGSRGWLDRGYWNQLQRAALTTFPSETLSEIKKDNER